MKDFEFSFPTKVIFGKQAENKVGFFAKTYGKKAMILYGSNRIKEKGLFIGVTNKLKEAGVDWIEFGGIMENPELSVVREGCREAKKYNVDLLIAIGGGSIIDAAKAISISYYYDGDVWDLYLQKEVPTKALPIGVILTAASTASEVNCISVISNDKTGRKIVFPCPLTYPKFALMNPELTYTLSAYQTAIGAIDIFSHSFERFFHIQQKGTLHDSLCAAVMKTIIDVLPKTLIELSDYNYRGQLMWAASISHGDIIGMEGDFACHEISHILTEVYNIPHGASLAIIMPAWCKFMLKDNYLRLVDFAKLVWNVNDNGISAYTIAQEAIAEFQEFMCKCGLATTLGEYGIYNVDSQILADKIVENPEEYIGGNFMKLYNADVKAIIELAKG